MSRDHRRLKAFKLTDALVVRVYRETTSFPKHEMYGITSQMRRAAVSSAANIVEGCARSSEKEYIHFLNTALGSLRELGYLINLSVRIGYLEKPQTEELESQYEESARVLSGLIRSLRGGR